MYRSQLVNLENNDKQHFMIVLMVLVFVFVFIFKLFVLLWIFVIFIFAIFLRILNSIIQKQRYSRRKWQMSGIFKDVRLSTLMDLSLSSIKQPQYKQTANTKYQNHNTKYKSLSQNITKQTQNQVQQMRKKLNKIMQKQLIIQNYQPYVPKTFTQNEQDMQDRKYMLQMKKQVIKDRINKAIKHIYVIFVGRLYRQVDIYDTIKMMQRKRKREKSRLYFYGWVQYVEKQGQRRNIMKMIKQRIIAKRKDKLMLNQILQQTVQQISQIKYQHNSSQIIQ